MDAAKCGKLSDALNESFFSKIENNYFFQLNLGNNSISNNNSKNRRSNSNWSSNNNSRSGDLAQAGELSEKAIQFILLFRFNYKLLCPRSNRKKSVVLKKTVHRNQICYKSYSILYLNFLNNYVCRN